VDRGDAIFGVPIVEKVVGILLEFAGLRLVALVAGHSSCRGNLGGCQIGNSGYESCPVCKQNEIINPLQLSTVRMCVYFCSVWTCSTGETRKCLGPNNA
jgi:hypothetical protein